MALPDQPLHAGAAGDGRGLCARRLDPMAWRRLAPRRLAVRRALPVHRRQVRRTRLPARSVPLRTEFLRKRRRRAGRARRVAAIRQARGPHILYFGRLSPEKGVDVLIDAAAAADAPLTIVGDGPQRASLEAQARALGARCLFTGRLNGAALWAEVEAATAVALPSVWYEIAPKSALEAQARAKPVIASRIGGLPELIEDGETGLLVAPNDRADLASGLRRILAMDDGALAAMGAKGRQRTTSASAAIATTAK